MSEQNHGLVLCEDNQLRPPWATMRKQLRDYYDHEWGKEVRGEQAVFERVCLEGFQAGLSWSTILAKREAFREVYHRFDVDKVAAMTDADIDRLMQDKRILRNRRKLSAAVKNAKATIALREEGGLSDLVWSFAPDAHQRPKSVDEIPSTSDESKAMAKALKKAGFTFVGPTTCYALMQAIGMVDDRVVGSAGLRG
ncbi:DNA-3-methyladenine glycosylase I [Corynebacterium sp. ZY180755]